MSRPYHDTPYRDAPAAKAAPARESSAPGRKPPKPRQSHRNSEPPAAQGTPPGRRRSSRRRRRGGGGTAPVQLTSHPTSRNAYVQTRLWLLEQHGPVCAYCGVRFTASVMTLDHVTPRRGQTAYDRRDNLVLACPGCNAAKRDLSPVAYLLASRTRAMHLLRYGAHLSPMLLDLARSLAPAGSTPVANGTAHAAPPASSADVSRWLGLDDGDDGESPYKD